MVGAGKEDPELNLLVGRPDPRVGRRSLLQVAGLLAAAGAAGYAGGTVAGWGDEDPSGATEAGGAQPISGNRRNERLLNVYHWSDYIDDRTIPLFQAQANIRVNYDVYSSNDDLLARMKAGPTDYDIIVPTNNFVPTFMKLDLLEPLRQDLIPNLTNLDREFVETDYDPGNRYTVPWQWGTTGIGFNRKRAGDEVDSWAAVFEPSSAMGGHVTLLREVTDLIGCALIYLAGAPTRSTTPTWPTWSSWSARSSPSSRGSPPTPTSTSSRPARPGWPRAGAGTCSRPRTRTRTSATSSPRKARCGSSTSWPCPRAPPTPATPPAS